MKRILTLLLCFVSIVPIIMADEKEDSLDDITQRSSQLNIDSQRSTLLAYKQIRENISQDTVYAELVSEYAVSCFKAGYYVEAIYAMSEAAEIYKSVYGGCHRNYAVSLNDLSGFYYACGDFTKAIELATEALIIYKNLNEGSLDYATTMGNLALFYSDTGDYITAIHLGEQALYIYNQTIDEEDSYYAALLDNLSYYYYDLGNYSKAIELGSRALIIRKEILNHDDPDYATSLDHLAIYYSISGDYIKALEFGNEAMEIRRKVLGDKHPNYAASLSHLSYFYSHLGNYSKAIELDLEALEIRGEKLGFEHPYYATSLNNLSYDYYLLGDFEKAIELGTRAMKIRQKAWEYPHSDYANSLGNLATYYSAIEDYEKAIEFATLALEINKKNFGERHPFYAKTLGDLALYYSAIEDYEKAIEICSKALEITRVSLGEKSLSYSVLLSHLAYFNYSCGYLNVAIPLLNTYTHAIHNHVTSTLVGLTVNERQMYWSLYSMEFNHIIPKILVQSGIFNAASILYDETALFAKGLLLSTEQEMSKIIQECGDDEALQMYSELRNNRQLLNVQYSKPFTERQIDCDSLEEVSSMLERRLATRVKEFGDYTRNLSITWRDVQNRLNDDDIAIEFLSYFDIDGGTTYAALTLCKGDTMPMLTPLFVESQLNTASSIQDTYQTPITDAIVWGGLSSRLQGKSHVYFSASGMLHNIGIEFLPSMEGKECHRLSSTRELVTHHTSSTISSAMLYGGIDYKASYASIESSIPNSVKDYAMTASTSQYRGRFDYRTLRYGVSALPRTKEEITEVSAMLKPLGISLETLSGTQASEESFKALSGQRKSLIHIATHGFYYTSEEADNLSDNMRLMFIGENRPRNVEDQSLLRCGLCFAGANQILSGESKPSDGQDDGILNALEIAQTDLRGLDLVVLSACQTALGDIALGEGVFGLQRGFKKAGAQSILMSLWEVDNDATHLLMTEFYKGWTSGLSKYAALRQAQAVVKEKYPDPKYWAAFILLDAID